MYTHHFYFSVFLMEYSFNIDDYINDPLIQQSVLFIIQMCKQLSLFIISLFMYFECVLNLNNLFLLDSN